MNYLKVLKENKNYFEDFITRSTYHSNAIEGSTLSMSETYALLFDSTHCNIENANPREIYEAINHKNVLIDLLERIEQKKPLTEEFLININQKINENIIYVGGYRLGPIRIIGSKKTFPLPKELSSLMHDFIISYNKLLKEDIHLLDISKMHIQYENIHPFPDGNGRTGRLLINYLLLSCKKAPIVVPMEKRKEYLECMEKNDVEALSLLFESFQKEEEERIQDFIKMEEEK